MGFNVPSYSLGEEIANSITHGVGILASVVGLVIAVALAAVYAGKTEIVAVSIHGFSLVLLYTASTLYHGVGHLPAKMALKRFDHAAIFVLIAGSYTPYALVTLENHGGMTLLIIVWSIALFGVIYKTVFPHKLKGLSLPLYLGMGWLMVFYWSDISANLTPASLAMLIAGGVAYTLGAVFYAIPKRWFHAVWHLFVLAGSVLHYLSILYGIVLA